MCGHKGVGGRQHCHWDTVSSCCCEEIMRSYPSLCVRLFISLCSLLPCDYCCKWSLPWGNPSSKNCDWWNWVWYSIFLMLEKKKNMCLSLSLKYPQTDEKKAQLLSAFNKWAPKPYLNTHTHAATHKNWPGPLYLLLFSPVAFTALLSFPTLKCVCVWGGHLRLLTKEPSMLISSWLVTDKLIRYERFAMAS